MKRPNTAGVQKVISSPNIRKVKYLPYVSEENLQQKGHQLRQTQSKMQLEKRDLQQQLLEIEQEKQRQIKAKEESQGNQSWLGIKLKIQINQLNSKIEEKELQIKELQKNPNYTKAKESNILIEYLNYCSSMLRTEQTLMPNELEDLRIEIQELEISKRLLEEQSENLAIHKSLLEKRISTQYLELDQHKADLKERERDLRYLKKEILKYEEKQKDVQQNQKVTVKKSVIEDIDDKKAEIIEKDQYISNQEIIINQLKEKLQERTNYELKSKNILIDELQLLQNQVQSMKDELKQLNNYYISEVQPLETEALPILQGNKDHTFTILHDVYNKQEKKFIRAQRVKFEQILDMGKELSLRLQLKQISVQEAAQILVGTKNSVTIEELQEQLLQEPFTIADPNDAKLLARYMVEDSNDDYVNLDPKISCKTAVVKSVFRHLVGCYVLLTAEQDKQYWEEVSQIIIKYEQSLRSQFDIFNKQLLGFMKPKDLFYCLDQLFLDLTDQQKEYILLRLFAYTNNIQKILHTKIFDVFKSGSYIDRVSKDNRKKNTRVSKKIAIQKDSIEQSD